MHIDGTPPILSTIYPEIADSNAEASIRLQNWAFVKAFALAIESGKTGRLLFHCVHHKTNTQNSSKTLEAA